MTQISGLFYFAQSPHLFLSLFLDLTSYSATWQELTDNTGISRSCQVLHAASKAKERCRKDKLGRSWGLAKASKEHFLAVLETHILAVSYETDEILLLPWEHMQEIGKSTCLKSKAI